jgi:hypothetical protein
MTLKVVKNNKGVSGDGIFIIEATNVNNETGYIADVNKKISVSSTLIPQVIRYSTYKEAKVQLNHIESNIQGLKLKILGRKQIEEILSKQGDLDVVVPVGDVKGNSIVSVYDKTTKEIIGYISLNPENNTYFMKKNKDGVAFWEGDKVNQFIEGASKTLLQSYPNLELKPEPL